MAEQTKTEKLREEMEGILEPTLDRLYHQDLPEGKYAEIAIKASVGMLKGNITTQILEACKEAGLKFIPDTIANAYGDGPTWFENVEEIEL